MLTILIVALAFAWAILPMLILRENYVFTIHDGLDSYAAMTQNIHDNHMYFRLWDNMPFMHGIEGKYTMMSYALYDFLNCMFGYLPGQILTRIIGVTMGFFSLRTLLGYIFPKEDRVFSRNVIDLISIAYAITPIAPNRMIAYASLPIVIYAFLRLCGQKTFTKMSVAAALLPLISGFQTVFIFAIPLWAFIGLIKMIADKKININLIVSFVGMCMISVAANYPTFWIALSADDTNRSLSLTSGPMSVNLQNLKVYLLEGEGHATTFQQYVLLEILAVGTVFAIYAFIKDRKDSRKKMCMLIVAFGWFFWLATAFVRVLFEGGFQTGILIIDGYSWGESIALMRLVFYIMLAAVFFMLYPLPVWKYAIYIALCVQLVMIAKVDTVYNDTYHSLSHVFRPETEDEEEGITFGQFFDTDLFDEIKEDIGYSGEGIVAYGYHPAVLMYNDFYTIDGYLSVHSMKWQNEFREIIAPGLERDEKKKEYYDTWGGRMYIFGPLSYYPEKIKEIGPEDIYIDSEAYKRYDGKYVLSRTRIANADEQNLSFVNDYDSKDGIYHMYLYEVN